MMAVSPGVTTCSPDHGSEVTHAHTRLLRISLVMEESQAYWENLTPNLGRDCRGEVAFTKRWFGNKSMVRVKRLLTELNQRFEDYPTALQVLHQWCPRDMETRRNICHWHLQLVDPIYRRFTGEYLVKRRYQHPAVIDRDLAVRWVTDEINATWSAATTQRMATSLIAAAARAGLCSDKSGVRPLSYPRVTDDALTYWLYFLRHLTFSGSLLENPYFASVGLVEGFLEQRLRRLPGLRFQRMGELHEFGWQYPDLLTWGREGLRPPEED